MKFTNVADSRPFHVSARQGELADGWLVRLADDLRNDKVVLTHTQPMFGSMGPSSILRMTPREAFELGAELLQFAQRMAASEEQPKPEGAPA